MKRLADHVHFLTTRDVCEILGLSRQRVHQLVQDSELGPIRVGPRSYLYLESDVARYQRRRADGLHTTRQRRRGGVDER